MRRVKKIFKVILNLFLIVTVLLDANIVAASKSGKETGYGCQKGKYIYYAFEMSGVRMGIQRYNIKTQENKEICSYMFNGTETNGFYNISVRKNYIYTVWDQGYGTSEFKKYIYRIKKDGSKKQRLACGDNPVIIGNRIYYEKCKLKKNNYEGQKYSYTESTGKIYSMKLDGTNKKKNKSIKMKKLSANSYGNNERTDTINGYQYYINGKSIYRKSEKTGKVKKVMSCSQAIYDFYICEQYILVRGAYKHDDWYKMAAYIVNVNGKEKKKLVSWNPAE